MWAAKGPKGEMEHGQVGPARRCDPESEETVVVEGRISVVIPALDEEASLARTIRSVAGDAEVIVVEGGSRDRSREIAETRGCRGPLVPALPGRTTGLRGSPGQG